MSEAQLISEMNEVSSTIEAYNSDLIDLDEFQVSELETKRDALLNIYYKTYMPSNVVRLF